MSEPRTVVVTGAGSGLGLAIADHLTAEGSAVVRLDLNEAPGVHPFDVLDEACWEALPYDGVTGLVHAAGVREQRRLADTTLESFRTVLDVNATGTFLALRWASRSPRATADRGPRLSVVTLSSAVVDRLPKHQLAYNASKAAIDALTRTAAKELAAHGIRVNAIAPVSILTPMTEAGWADQDHAARMRTEIPAGRPGEPREVASAASFLLSAASSYMNGSVLTVDGGWTV